MSQCCILLPAMPICRLSQARRSRQLRRLHDVLPAPANVLDYTQHPRALVDWLQCVLLQFRFLLMAILCKAQKAFFGTVYTWPLTASITLYRFLRFYFVPFALKVGLFWFAANPPDGGQAA